MVEIELTLKYNTYCLKVDWLQTIIVILITMVIIFGIVIYVVSIYCIYITMSISFANYISVLFRLNTAFLVYNVPVFMQTWMEKLEKL